MKYLLDTHSLLWFLNGERLSGKIRTLISDGDCFVSVVSLWEIAIKMNIGKYEDSGGFPALLALVRKNGFMILPIKDRYLW